MPKNLYRPRPPSAKFKKRTENDNFYANVGKGALYETKKINTKDDINDINDDNIDNIDHDNIDNTNKNKYRNIRMLNYNKLNSEAKLVSNDMKNMKNMNNINIKKFKPRPPTRKKKEIIPERPPTRKRLGGTIQNKGSFEEVFDNPNNNSINYDLDFNKVNDIFTSNTVLPPIKNIRTYNKLNKY